MQSVSCSMPTPADTTMTESPVATLAGFPTSAVGPTQAVVLWTRRWCTTAEGTTFAGPVLRSAERACEAYLPPAGGPPPRVRAQTTTPRAGVRALYARDTVCRISRTHPPPAPRSDWGPASTRSRPPSSPLHACAAPASATSRSGAEDARPRPDEPPREASVLAEDPNREASRFQSTRH